MSTIWPFTDVENTACFTLQKIVNKEQPILVISHDADDGCWQFLDGSDEPDPDAALVLALVEMVALDPTIAEVADLPLGWLAWRDAPGEPWRREENADEDDEDVGTSMPA